MYSTGDVLSVDGDDLKTLKTGFTKLANPSHDICNLARVGISSTNLYFGEIYDIL